ncbi:DNA-binding protein WhiA [Proteinivorax hydrogeniformans]|uniref:Probable cell division protein WhiA n=1 Tax=Proteinivorax hydrogeniformans TaxID=1826727 RepID=A0AAU8HV52_9FIRM
MSFASSVKNELCRNNYEQCCIKAELAALCLINGSVQINSKQGIVLHVSTENATIAKRMFNLIKSAFGISGQIFVKKKKKLKKNNSYLVQVSGQENVEDLLKELCLLESNRGVKDRIHEQLLKKSCCKRAFLRGSFLASGSVNNPETSSYHAEISLNSESQCDYLIELCAQFGLEVKKTSRKKYFLLYIKDSDIIVDFLNVIGAHNALLSFENTRVYKEMRNNVNRVVNCETANLNKTVDAAQKQIENINLIDRYIGLDNIPQQLQEVAYMRLKDSSLSLKEIGEGINPPVGKSGINHRFKKIEKIANSIRAKSKPKN